MKKICSVFLTIFLIVISMLTLCACSLFDMIEPAPNSPVLRSYGNIIMWDEVENANYYRIYVNHEEFDTTQETYYIFSESKYAADISVRTVNDKDKESNDSNIVTIQQTTDFTDDDVKNINCEEENGEIFIEPEIKYVRLSGKAQNSTGITIRAARTDDLIIELDNVTMISGSEYSCIRTENDIYDEKELKFAVTLILNGNNSLTGGSQYYVPPQPRENSGERGKNGYAGRSAIILPTVVMTGSGSLSLKGGNGSDGGTGADSSGWAMQSFGHGGNGGAGGNGLVCTTAVLAIDKGSRITAVGGTGGEGGSPGSNGSIITGPWVTGAWSLNFGETGETGKEYVGNLITISGKFM